MSQPTEESGEPKSVTDKLERTPYSFCPLCSSTQLKKLGSYDSSEHPLYSSQLTNIIMWQACEDCAHVFTQGYFSGEAGDILADNVNPDRLLAIENSEVQRIIAGKMVATVSNQRKSTCGKWLDVGFGDGSLC